MKIKSLSNGNVRLSYYEVADRHDQTVSEVIRDFFVNDGCVYEWADDGSDRSQVCDALDGMGPTLRCRDEANLPAVIRREYQRMVQSQTALYQDERDYAWERGNPAPVFDGDILSQRHPWVKAALATA